MDVYAHFWEDVESSKTTGTTHANIELFKQLYSPKAIRTDPPLRGDEYPLEFIQRATTHPISCDNVLDITDYRACIVRNCVSMYTSMERAYDVFETHRTGQYDWIIRTRSDCVLLRCPRLDFLDNQYLYVPNWHGDNTPCIVNHTVIMPEDIAPALFRIRRNIETLQGPSDEWFVYEQLKKCGVLPRVRTLPMSVFYPTLTRNGIQTDRPEPNLKSEIAPPPYSTRHAPQG